MEKKLVNKIFDVNDDDFEKLSIDIFHFQYQYNLLYKSYVDELKADPKRISSIKNIPFLPISFFKTHSVQTTSFQPEIIFESSGTTQAINSKHNVKELWLYKESFINGFRQFYGNEDEWCIIGLLPSYLERKNSSLVFMVSNLINTSKHPDSGFYLYEHNELNNLLQKLENNHQKTLVIGVTFALLDFAEKFPQHLKHTIIMETGGMKGRGKEQTRDEIHSFLKKRLGVSVIHAEYGMTELLSQAYSKGGGLFECVPWMKVVVRSEDDPFNISVGGSGIINVIDLANIYSCSFIATDDVGRVYENGRFEISGRVDNSDLRGCSLLVV